MGTPEWNVTLGSEPNNQTVALRWTMIIILNISNRWQWTQIFRQHGGWWLLFLTFQTDDHGQWTQIFRQHGVKQMLRWYKFSSRIQTCQKATTSKGSPWPYKRLLYQHLFHTEGESEKEILSVFYLSAWLHCTGLQIVEKKGHLKLNTIWFNISLYPTQNVEGENKFYGRDVLKTWED